MSFFYGWEIFFVSSSIFFVCNFEFRQMRLATSQLNDAAYILKILLESS